MPHYADRGKIGLMGQKPIIEGKAIQRTVALRGLGVSTKDIADVLEREGLVDHRPSDRTVRNVLRRHAAEHAAFARTLVSLQVANTAAEAFDGIDEALDELRDAWHRAKDYEAAAEAAGNIDDAIMANRNVAGHAKVFLDVQMKRLELAGVDGKNRDDENKGAPLDELIAATLDAEMPGGFDDDE